MFSYRLQMSKSDPSTEEKRQVDVKVNRDAECIKQSHVNQP